jgi:hypothetical protein
MSGRGLAMKSIELIRVSYELLEQIQPRVRSVGLLSAFQSRYHIQHDNR